MEQPLLFDGAFGTYYDSMMSAEEKTGYPELANLKDPEMVLRIHREYIESGARAIKTNTYGANSRLTTEPQVLRKVLINGYTLATQAAEGKAPASEGSAQTPP